MYVERIEAMRWGKKDLNLGEDEFHEAVGVHQCVSYSVQCFFIECFPPPKKKNLVGVQWFLLLFNLIIRILPQIFMKN